MSRRWIVLLVGLLALCAFSASAAEATKTKKKKKPRVLKPWPTTQEGATAHVFKKTGQGDLRLFVFAPEGGKPGDKRPAMVFFFGGGWANGGVGQFSRHAKHLATLGMVGVVAEYRIKNRHKTTPFECVTDGLSAVRWLRAHAGELGIDPERLGAGGGSAGGHVALATATLGTLAERGEDTSVSAMPNALALFNAVIDTTATGWKGGPKQLGERCEDLSPIHRLAKKMPPTLIMHGTKDKTVPFENAQRLEKLLKEQGVHAQLVPYEGRGHGFFNFGRNGGDDYFDTLKRLDAFLREIAWIK